jgi:hypothetical protein
MYRKLIFYLLTLISSCFQLLFIPFNGEIAPCIVPPKKSFINSFNSIVLPSINKLTSNKHTLRTYSYIELKFFFYRTVLYFCYLSLGDRDTAMKYQRLLSTLDEKPLDSVNMTVPDSKLNPFYLSKGTMEQQIKNMALLHTINDSFTGKLKTGR